MTVVIRIVAHPKGPLVPFLRPGRIVEAVGGIEVDSPGDAASWHTVIPSKTRDLKSESQPTRWHSLATGFEIPRSARDDSPPKVPKKIADL
jgi:hypothetical protein